MSEGLESFYQALGGAKLVTLIEVVGARVLVHGSTLQQVIASGENGVRHGHDGSFHSARCRQTTKLCRKISILRFRRRPGSLAQSVTSPAVPLTALSTRTFSGALVIARTNSDPTG